MVDFLGKYKNDYIEIFFEEENNYYKIYKGFNQKTNKYIFLKVFNINQLKSGNYNYLLKQINTEEEITKLCNSDNTINFYRKLETPENIIFELEYMEINLKDYLKENGSLKGKLDLFKNIVLSLAEALSTIYQKGVIHRDINPHNVYIKSLEDENKIIKLGNFSSSIYKKDNISESIGSIYYSAPEIIKNLKYDEKCDLWSLGVTLYELYFGELPYGKNTSLYTIKKALYQNNFIFKKTKIPTLDILFKKLLARTPKNRMTYKEFFSYVFGDGFLIKDAIYVNNNLIYKNIYEMILKEQQLLDKKNNNKTSLGNSGYDYVIEGLNFEMTQKECTEKIFSFLEDMNLPDMVNIYDEITNIEKKYNNIIYYDENINFINTIYINANAFENHTPGAFILCTSIDSLKIIKEEILRENVKDNRIIFNLISAGSSFETVMQFLEENSNFKNCIRKACIFCSSKSKYIHLKDKYNDFLDEIYFKKIADIFTFIDKYSSKDIKPFPQIKLITYDNYINKYNNIHFTISKFYGDLTKETYNKYYQKMKNVIDKKAKINGIENSNMNTIFKAFLSFDLKKDVEELDKLIIKEYTTVKFHKELNLCLLEAKEKLYEPVAYLTARLMYHINSYALRNNKFCIENKKIFFRGFKISYSNILPYKRAEGKIICLTSFTSTTESSSLAKNFAGRGNERNIFETSLIFSVVYIITNLYKDNFVSSGIDIQNISNFRHEKESIFQPFTFYFVRKVQIDDQNYNADIYLETIGKNEILEKEIRNGKEIEYNRIENIFQIKK